MSVRGSRYASRGWLACATVALVLAAVLLREPWSAEDPSDELIAEPAVVISDNDNAVPACPARK